MSKSSSIPEDPVYIWYLNLRPGSILNWGHMVSNFNTKFFFIEAKYSLAELGRTSNYLGEDLDLFTPWVV